MCVILMICNAYGCVHTTADVIRKLKPALKSPVQNWKHGLRTDATCCAAECPPHRVL